MAKIKASTQEHLDIESIEDDLVILKTGWVALVLRTTAVNFDLLSEAEQDAAIYAYGAFLNSLSFATQILIRTKKADITSYFQHLAEAEQSQQNPDLKRQIQKYEDFIQSTVQQKTVLEKEFYVIVDFSPLELGISGLVSKKVQKGKEKAQLVADAKIALYPKRDHLKKQLSRLGLVARQLVTQELVELFYDIYNPAPSGTGRVILDSSAYMTTMVSPAVEVPSPAPTGTGKAAVGGGQQQFPVASEKVVETGLRPVPSDPPVGLRHSDDPLRFQSDVKSDAGEIRANDPILAGQTGALKNLQEAVGRAAQFVNERQAVNNQGQLLSRNNGHI